MTHSRCSGFDQKSRGSVTSIAPRSLKQQRRSRLASTKIIEQTRGLMEKTIEFVTNPDFERSDAIKCIQAIRPKSLDDEPVFEAAKQGLVFVSGLVQSPLLTDVEERYLFTRMNYLKFRAEQNRRKLDLSRPDRFLVEQIHSDLDEALRVRNHIVQANLRLVVAVARKLARTLEQMSEMIGEGMSPLIRSVELFDVSLGNRFSTYATWAVRNQMLRLLKRARQFREAGEETPSLENLPDYRSSSDVAACLSHLQMEAVNQLLQSLSERERAIVRARFGLDGHPRGQSLAVIAEQMDLSKERVRQIVLSALSKLRGIMNFDEFAAMC